jgi:hypothetical protein
MDPITLAFVFALGWQYVVTPAIEAMKPPTELICTPRGDGFACTYQAVKPLDQVAAVTE